MELGIHYGDSVKREKGMEEGLRFICKFSLEVLAGT